MINPNLKIQFRDLMPSPAIGVRIEHEFEKLLRHHGNIQGLRAMISAPDHHHRHGRHFQLRLEIDLNGTVIEVGHEPSTRQALTKARSRRAAKSVEIEPDHKDAYVVIRDAFAIAQRRLDEHVRRDLTRSRAVTNAGN
jgi:hypothetical protein